MKELSIEEKAKAYDEALEQAKKQLNTCGSIDCDAARQIFRFFPELKESEGDRIRKEMIFYFQEEIPQCSIQEHADKMKEFITWLEKPKYTEKDLDKAYKCADEVQYRRGYEDAKKEIEKQGEQNPAEWHREDEQNLNVCLGYIPDEFLRRWLKDTIHVKYEKPTDKVEPKFKVKYAGSEYNVLEVKDIAGVTYYGIEDEPNHIDYVQAENCEKVGGYSIKEKGSPYPTKPAKFSEQKPAWSEEDEISYTFCASAIKTRYNDGLFTTAEYIKTSLWLKSLKERMKGE